MRDAFAAELHAIAASDPSVLLLVGDTGFQVFDRFVEDYPDRFINMGVALNLLPVTGLTLPLVSMGGTSLWFTSIAIGIVLSVSKQCEDSTQKTIKKSRQIIRQPI